MTMPHGHRSGRSDDRLPDRRPRPHLRLPAPDAATTRSSGEMEFPAEYMFKDVPNRLDRGRRPLDVTLARDGPVRRRHRPDRCWAGEVTSSALQRPPRPLRRQPRGRPQRHHRRRCARSGPPTTSTTSRRVTTFPAGCNPQVPVSDRRYYPIYQTCIDLDIPIISTPASPGRASRRRARTSCTSTRSVTTSPSCAS